MDQRDAFWQVPQVSNVVVQKIVLTKEKEKRTKLAEIFGHRASQTLDSSPSLLEKVFYKMCSAVEHNVESFTAGGEG